METTTTTAKLFLTDYNSYNEGKQFKYGHWIELSQFSDADEFIEYMNNHFSACNIIDPEPMFTDFEGFPRELYSESYSKNELENLFLFLSLDPDELPKVSFLLEQGYEIKEALQKYDEIELYEYTGENDIWELFEMYYPDAVRAEESCYYLNVNYDQFKNECFIEFNYEGTDYLIPRDTY